MCSGWEIFKIEVVDDDRVEVNFPMAVMNEEIYGWLQGGGIHSEGLKSFGLDLYLVRKNHLIFIESLIWEEISSIGKGVCCKEGTNFNPLRRRDSEL